MPRKQRTNTKSIIDRFEPPNEAIICPLHGGAHGTSNGSSSASISRQSSHTNSPKTTQRQISSQSNVNVQNGNLSRKSSQGSSTKIQLSIKSPTSSHESYESALSTACSAGGNLTSTSHSSSSSTLKSNILAQPEEDEDLDGSDGADGMSGNGSGGGTRAECTRFTRQALYTYRAKNHLIHYKYSAYGGTCHDLPK